ncbi:MAG TPA: type II CAAX endopeptidase family protein [Flavobacterium sp.]|uniref:CPBP family intramembrane glutamic endopeptidase n=1 Tax=Flavobacterium sp. TaxID=239 RepID=UPI002BE5D9AE|nr:type II CAAX endopeptidase family protein [Flavobacterium sp.]HSD13587.1 type II CAAX endopeptidase family protein [Flavobacterium sp.]
MNTISKLLNNKLAAFLLFAIAFGFIFNPWTKFPYTFICIIFLILLFTFLQDGNLKALNFRKIEMKSIGIILIAYVVLELSMDFIFQPLINKIFNEPADYSSFEALKGNSAMYFKYLVFMWVSAAFSEELLFRAFAFSQFRRILGNQKIVLVILTAVLFSLPHLYQGAVGLVITFLFGLAFGWLYQKYQNIWINIIVHGLIDTFFLTLAYYGLLSFFS